MAKIQTKHIPTEFILEAVSHLTAIPKLHTNANRFTSDTYPAKVTLNRGIRPAQIHMLWPDIPEKVIRSKMEKMVQEELLFESFDRYSIWPKGHERLLDFRRRMGLSMLVDGDFLTTTLHGSIEIIQDDPSQELQGA